MKKQGGSSQRPKAAPRSGQTRVAARAGIGAPRRTPAPAAKKKATRRAPASAAAPVRRVVATKDAPAAIGPYSQAIAAGGFLFCSGQIPLDPRSGELVTGDIRAQTRRVLDNLRAVLEAGGATLQSVVKVGIFLSDMGFFADVNAVYAEYFGHEPPARATVAVKTLPRGADVEIDATALIVR